MSSTRARVDDAGGVRGPLLALSSAALAIAAHGLGGGTLSESGFTVLLATLLAWGGASVARRGGTLALVGVLGVTQLSQHLLLTEIAGGHRSSAAFDGWTMFATHAVATLLTALLLTRAGAALGTINAGLAWLLRRLTALAAGPVLRPEPITRSALPARPGEHLEVLFRQVHTRRGPPLTS